MQSNNISFMTSNIPIDEETLKFEERSIIQNIKLPNLGVKHNLYLKRDDLIHEKISGNKWRKLKYNIIEAKEKGIKRLLTFGGAYSNHIHAFAYAGKLFGFETIGIIRGEFANENNSTLTESQRFGMKIFRVSKEIYKDRNSVIFHKKLKEQFGDIHIIPEGGTNYIALKGAAEIVNDEAKEFDYICAASGTGGTVAGILLGSSLHQTIISVPILKNGLFIKSIIESFMREYGVTKTNFQVIDNYHLGGYAKFNFELFRFIQEFYYLNGVNLDPVYTGKLLFSIRELIKTGYFPKEKRILAIHTGGLQGIEGYRDKIENFLQYSL